YLKSSWKNNLTSQETAVALVARKRTDVLLIRIAVETPEIALDPLDTKNGAAVRASYLSLAHLIRRQACLALDIETDELNVGVRLVSSNDARYFEIYLTDTLENGAGYCAYLGDPEVFQELVLQPLMPGGKSHQQLLKHAESCDSSCYECLRDFNNAGEHALLDWRLGLDLLKIALAESPSPPSLDGYWESVSTLAAQSLQNVIPSSSVEQFKNLLCVILNGQLHSVVTHPFWPIYQCDLNDLAKQLAVSVNQLPNANVFDIVRRPGAILSSTKKQLPHWSIAPGQLAEHVTTTRPRLNLSELSEKLPQRGEFDLILPDNRLNRIAAEGHHLTFEKLRKDTKPDELRGKIVIVKDPNDPSKFLFGKLYLQPLQDSQGALTEVKVHLQPQSNGVFSSDRRSIPIADWPHSFHAIARLSD
ncbi:MAG: hypothetical protein RLY14_2021, partial [Planctomycetota bacterium]